MPCSSSILQERRASHGERALILPLLPSKRMSLVSACSVVAQAALHTMHENIDWLMWSSSSGILSCTLRQRLRPSTLEVLVGKAAFGDDLSGLKSSSSRVDTNIGPLRVNNLVVESLRHFQRASGVIPRSV
ncbi:hypothetical protein EXIGLDRAFT_717616 [Exidia glandulosa HHB12029]|uniref:Uncharacterized protein n=1 Tax=Exidia glandulosa HHB12029 TaxID=1314781 RepID=A0A165I981_EXIGL|nr:hypothetical protein EXIGLDRAFT_717616 [Exidia glandulosa HHB12029]